jgi:hypothetical protein
MIAGCSVWAVQATRRLTTIAIDIFYVFYIPADLSFFFIISVEKLVDIYSLAIYI